jgi:hypothetical protein
MTWSGPLEPLARSLARPLANWLVNRCNVPSRPPAAINSVYVRLAFDVAPLSKFVEFAIIGQCAINGPTVDQHSSI